MALLALFYMVSPQLLAQRFGATLAQISGFNFSNKAAHFEFSPPGLAITQAKLANAQGQVVAEAEILHVPLAALWRGWAGSPLAFENASVHGYAIDGREHFLASKITGSSTLNADGSLVASGTGDVGITHLIADLSLVSLERTLNDGAPADFNLTSKLVSATYSGRLKLKDGFDLAGTMNLETADTRAFLASLGASVPAIRQVWPLGFTAAVETKEGRLSFSNIEGRLGSMKALGNATYAWPAGRPTLTLDLGMDAIDLSLFGLGNPTPQGPWSEKPFDLTALDSLDAVWHISSNGLRLGTLDVGPGQFDGSLKDRILDATYTTKNQQAFNGHFSLDGQGLQPAVELSLNATDLNGKSAVSSLAGFDFLDGVISLSTKLSTSGDSPAALVAKLSGTLDLKVKDGQVSGLDAAALVQAAQDHPVDGWNGGQTGTITAQGNLNFADGIGTFQQGSFNAPNVALSIAGDVDLLRRALELKLAPVSTANKKQDNIVVSGHWDQPKFLADKSP